MGSPSRSRGSMGSPRGRTARCITPKWRRSGGSLATARSRSWPATSRSQIAPALRRPVTYGLGPALRGLDVTPDGTVYVAASACGAVLKVAPAGSVSVVLRASDAWTPTGVAISGDDLYVLEYRYVESKRREDWLPRVRRVNRDGKVSIIAAVERR